MADIEHNLLTGSEIHEPKGADSADEDQFYVSDGAGSGSWKTAWTSWWWNYDSSETVATSLTSGVKTDLENDGAGVASLDFNKLPTASDIWDTSTNSFDWEAGGCQLGDTVDLRIDLEFTVNSSNDGFTLYLDLADGETGEINLPIFEHNVDTTGTQRLIIPVSTFIGNSTILTSPAKLSIEADSASDSVLLNGFYIRVIPTNPVYI